MSPEQRQRLLENLPPERRMRIEERLRKYESLTPEQRQRLREQFERFRQLPPERQQAVRQLFQRFSQLPEDRRRAVRRGVWELQMLGPARRAIRIERPWFKNRYSPDELQMIRELLEVARLLECARVIICRLSFLVNSLTAATLARGAVRAGCLGSKSRRAKHFSAVPRVGYESPSTRPNFGIHPAVPIFNLDSKLRHVTG